MTAGINSNLGVCNFRPNGCEFIPGNEVDPNEKTTQKFEDVPRPATSTGGDYCREFVYERSINSSLGVCNFRLNGCESILNEVNPNERRPRTGRRPCPATSTGGLLQRLRIRVGGKLNEECIFFTSFSASNKEEFVNSSG
ncbi:hypothetical protein CEXT_303781 [Caerostris extrusa]|uniref:Uncharacterized protein n=1 Tax=Caerostris extrusa TaxID=172846 RepID=A0AAV4MNX2_CAEEX|nr:hypothetical protein CEXT_303781 [Caerostris extrusa]